MIFRILDIFSRRRESGDCILGDSIPRAGALSVPIEEIPVSKLFDVHFRIFAIGQRSREFRLTCGAGWTKRTRESSWDVEGGELTGGCWRERGALAALKKSKSRRQVRVENRCVLPQSVIKHGPSRLRWTSLIGVVDAWGVNKGLWWKYQLQRQINNSTSQSSTLGLNCI